MISMSSCGSTYQEVPRPDFSVSVTDTDGKTGEITENQKEYIPGVIKTPSSETTRPVSGISAEVYPSDRLQSPAGNENSQVRKNEEKTPSSQGNSSGTGSGGSDTARPVTTQEKKPVQTEAAPAETPAVTEAEKKEQYRPAPDYEDNKWAAFLVSPSNPAYSTREQGEAILDVLSHDSVIGSVASLSKAAEAPADTTAYGTPVITAGGPVGYGSLAYGRLSEIPESFLNAMVQDMRNDLGSSYGGHSSGSGMGYRTFYQASYDADTGGLQVSQSNGYWARTLGAFSEHCGGVAVDFDISYQNSGYLSSSGRNNRAGSTMANNEFRWLADNAYRYGFIWRFKIDGSESSSEGNRTGTIREGWHWRFVGVYHATKFWEKCAGDTDSDGVPDTGYMTNDNYIWEDYYYDYISGNPSYPQNEYEAICDFYNSPQGSRCSYYDYVNSYGGDR